ncbi:MAG: phosphocholine cytidylyltransferase family protein [Balneolaceae bacterium]
MKVVILAAGEGSRLRPYTLKRPKCLVEIDGKSLLDRQLDVLKSEGVEEIVLIGGYLAGMLEGRGTRFYENPRYDETNMIWTLFCAEEELEGELLIAYGDIVYSKDALRALLASEADIAVTIDMEWESYWRARFEDPLDDAESLKMAPDGRLLEIGQKPDSVEDIQGQYMGLMKFSAEGTESLKNLFQKAKKDGSLRGKPVENAYMTDLLQALIDSGTRIDAVPVQGGWVEVDTVEDLESEITIGRLSEIG